MDSAIDVYEAILTRSLPTGCTIRGDIDLSRTAVSNLPDNLTIEGSLRARHCTQLTELPAKLTVRRTLDLTGCASLGALPADLNVGEELILDECSSLAALPSYWTKSISCRDCKNLSSIKRMVIGHLNLTNCSRISCLPGKMFVRSLNLTGCKKLKSLPRDLMVRILNVADSGLTDLPESSRGATLRWRGITIDWNIAFRPESITALDILNQQNAALRRVMLERHGLERFINSVRGEVIDQDTDPGGERSLIRCPLSNDEDIVCLRVTCPSTRAAYILRVPPSIRTCRQAAAWIAGFDNAEDYDPQVET